MTAYFNSKIGFFLLQQLHFIEYVLLVFLVYLFTTDCKGI